jgi:hypothetical protein
MKNFLLVLFCFIGIQLNAQHSCGEDFARLGLEGKSFAAATEILGQWHNDYQEFLLRKSLTENQSPESPDYFNFWKKATTDFFAEKGIDASALDVRKVYEEDFRIPATYSPEATELLNRLKALIDEHFEQADEAFYLHLNDLWESALTLPSATESISIATCISVTKSSSVYWHQNAQAWADRFTKESPAAQLTAGKKKIHINLGSLGWADAKGAFMGALGGATLGPGGAAAGAVLNAAVTSLGNLAGQIFSGFWNH